MKKDYFVWRMFYKMLIPSAISSIGFALSDMADALVVGQRMGETGLAAVSLCLPIYMLINVIMNAFGIGGGVKFSGYMGSGKRNEAVRCFNDIWKISLLSGILFALAVNLLAPFVLTTLGAGKSGTVLYRSCEVYMRIISLGAPLLILNVVLSNFLRNDNNEVIAARGFIIGNLTDLFLNIILVLVFNLGIWGAAASTVIGSAVAIACYLPAIIGKKRNIIRFVKSKTDFKGIFDCIKIGFSTSVQNAFQLVFLLVVNRVMVAIGGETGVAVFDVIYNASFFIVYLCEGTAEAAQPLVSTFMGEQSEEDCIHIRRLSVVCSLVFSGVVAVLIAIFAKYIAIVFGLSADVLPEAVYAIRIYCTGAAFVALNIILSRYCQSREDSLGAFINVLLKGLIVSVPCLLLFSSLGESYYVWYAFPVSEAVSFGLFFVYCCFANKKKMVFDKERIYRVTVSGDADEITELLDGSKKFCDKWGAKPSQSYYVTLVIEEIVASIVRNALKQVPNGKIRITLIAMPDGDFMLHILDNAVAYDPLHFKGKADAADFDIDEVSVMLVKKKAKKYLYRQCTGFNSLTVQI